MNEQEIIKKYQVLTETSPDCIKLFDTKGKLLYINPGGLYEHGLESLEDALTQNWQAIETVVEKDRPKFEEAMKKAVEDGLISTIEIEHNDTVKTRDFCLETIAPVKDDTGNIIGIFGVSRDITEMKKAEAEINRSKTNLETEIEARTKELKNKVEELERMNKIMVNRELKMIELKEKMAYLEKHCNNSTTIA